MTETITAVPSPTGDPDPVAVGDAAVGAGAGAEVKRSGGRMEFLDALRGVAAMIVVFQHTLEQLSLRYRRLTQVWIRPGEVGVVLFFLCSGFIIPASIERYRSVKRFWIGRLFRLFPVYWAAMIAAFTLSHYFHRYPLPPATDGHLHYVVTNAVMVTQMMRAPMFAGSIWSLAYEMVFYLFMTALFLAGVHRRSVPLAGVALAVTVAVGAFKVDAFASITDQGAVGVAWMVGSFLVILVALLIFGRLTVPRTVAVAALLAVCIPLVADRRDALWFGALLFATMFVGTVLYRAVQGETTWATARWVVGAYTVVTLFVMWRATIEWADPVTFARINWRSESATFLGAMAIFLVGLALRNRSFPWIAAELGRISYSVYLIHPLVLYGIHPIEGHKALTEVIWVVVTVLVSMVTYRLIEKPFIDLGRKASARWGGPRTPSAASPTPAPVLTEAAPVGS
jgi:peptidoglycan/LPS O-acetylase OafA/YrhL